MKYILIACLVLGYFMVAAFFVERVERLGRFLLVVPMLLSGGWLSYVAVFANPPFDSLSELVVLVMGLVCVVGGIRFVVDLKW